ncbi:sulfatase [Cyclobacterium sp. 1_MG-2023]|uniref:sulfatase n=1 Tax=Cyclobacterium sp. 1_MG-2023 TaxID=3062681 RepID=UPI0026E47176|nr:sulfatase [Cyclobacterium sp. 1_MG-2023]MDO6439584.1 sulfatase [Cyclobacterium sp. 1_MG-2023]
MTHFIHLNHLTTLYFSNSKKKLTLFLFSLFILLSIQTEAQDKKKLNVLFMISDDLTATAISSYENRASLTPNIDQLASKGTRFTKAYCQYPVCGPSRASMMFGYYPNATTTYGYVSGRENVGPERQSWAQLFKDNGYYTARVGKIFHMGSVDIMKGRDGKDDPASWTERYNSPAPEVHAQGERELVQNNPFGLLEVSQDSNWNGGNQINIVKTIETEIHTDSETADKVSDLLRQHKNDPFFIAAGFFRPHVPFVAPKSYYEAYPYEQVVMPPKVSNDWDDIPEQGINYVNSLNGEMTEEQEKKAIAAYYASTSFLDEQVSKVLQTLEDEGLEENTIVIFTSDHGFFLGEHRFWMKVGLMEESVRVPLIIKVPGQKPAVCHSFAELIDLYPTISELAGLQAPKAIQGKSLGKLIDNPKLKVRDFAFSVSQRNGRMGYLIRSSDWAYIQYGDEAEGGMELYDMNYDKGQYNNLANYPQYSNVISEMQDLLKGKLADVRNNDLGITY